MIRRRAGIGALLIGLAGSISAWAQAAIRRWVDARPKDRHGAHEYDFADTDLDLAAERARHAEYQRRYDVPSEV